MKMFGKKVEGANIEHVVIPRHTGDLVFKATAVLDMDEFKKLCPDPKPGKKMMPGGKVVDDFKDPEYLEELKQYQDKRWAYLFLKSYQDSPGLEWETVDINDPTTWLNYEKELEEAKFTASEVQLLVIGMTTANSLNQTKIDEAKARFLAGLAHSNEQLSLTGGQNITQNGEPASVSESVPQA